jgi:IS5 family transposase
MRVVQNVQMEIGEVDISKMKFDPRSRDDIPKILRGLQYLYVDVALRKKLFHLLETEISPKADKRNGRPGMSLWAIFVCGVIRLDLNIDYDRLHELVNKHKDLREMLGNTTYDDDTYKLQTLKDNVGLLDVTLLDKINALIVASGHALVKKKPDEALRGRCDSFVVETSVHFPTDISLLYDAMRKVITLTAQWCERHGVSSWRQSAYNVRQIKQFKRAAQNTKRSKTQSEEQDKKNAQRVVEAHQQLLETSQQYLDKAKETHTTLSALCKTNVSTIDCSLQREIEHFMQHAQRQIDQTKRRVILGETIPHAEKVLSIFEPHTEWVSKGKAGVPVELGLRVCILEDQHQFILHHRVMEKETDDQVTVTMVTEAKKRHAKLNACSFDKGFHSPENQIALKEHLALVALPRKGKLSQQAKAAEQTEEFIKARRAHSAVESAINALEVHGLDICPDRGIEGFKRYVALAVVAKNIHRIGAILSQQEQKRAQRKSHYAASDPPYKKAA